ncbi:class I SAM-dependent methyltransferase [Flavobacterium agricola]|uniref:Class I SAM-dependent methyltransferase n=1 Tax=Flavobacterium agricola TaxID=2870839 RepID=A0ABY6M1V7_9FLAO|nr:class I SAM-dependent methyltransferase [Flavobacterium agricola]UYW01782.1 class I SAM-dependent methyltransferase [Flavobacterium agricola]
MMQNNITSRVIETKLIPWRELKFIQQDDFKEWINNGDKRLLESIKKYQFIDPFKVWHNEGVNYCLDGKHRYKDLELAVQNGLDVPEMLPATFVECSDIKEAAELVLVYSSAYAKITQQGLYDFVQNYNIDFPDVSGLINIPEFDDIEFQGLLNKMDTTTVKEEIIPTSLKEVFIMPPFSVLDSRQGDWQKRKRIWTEIIKSQETREEVELIAKSGQSSAIYELRNKMRDNLGREPDWDEIIAYAKKKGMHVYEGASIFDPVLCELLYRWFCYENGVVLDPFAGGSVRGIIADVLGNTYHGIDIREDQVKANERQALELNLNKVFWHTGDSNQVLDDLNLEPVDFVFSCPPYADLEKYSDDPADLSNMDYEQFKDVYYSIIKKSVAKLKEERFACFVVGDVRDKKGFYYNFVSDTIEAFKQAGMELYNEIILINVAGSLAIRAKRQFNNGRKVGKMHQNVLVFYKGDPKKIKENYPELNLDYDLEELNNQPNIAL